MGSRIAELIHDVRNPLNTISVNAELGKLNLEKNADILKAQEIFSKIIVECRRCSEKLDLLKTVVSDSSQSEVTSEKE